jgi:hypothetical protein
LLCLPGILPRPADRATSRDVPSPPALTGALGPADVAQRPAARDDPVAALARAKPRAPRPTSPLARPLALVRADHARPPGLPGPGDLRSADHARSRHGIPRRYPRKSSPEIAAPRGGWGGCLRSPRSKNGVAGTHAGARTRRACEGRIAAQAPLWSCAWPAPGLEPSSRRQRTHRRCETSGRTIGRLSGPLIASPAQARSACPGEGADPEARARDGRDATRRGRPLDAGRCSVGAATPTATAPFLSSGLLGLTIRGCEGIGLCLLGDRARSA